MTDQQDRAPSHRRLSPLTPVVRAPIVLLAVLGGSWQQLLTQEDLGITSLVLLGLLVAGAGYGVASWLRTKYWIDGDELRIDTGVISRQSRRIRIDRLQGVDIVQPLVARLLGLAELRFDVASGADREGSLAFLPHAEALSLRTVLLDRRTALQAGPGSTAPVAAAVERPLAQLDLGRLLVSLLLSTEMLWLVAGVVVFGTTFVLTGSFALVGGVVPALLAVGFALARRLTSYYGFRLSDSPAGLQVRRGLTAVSSQTISPARIQGLVVSEPLLWRPLGWARLEVSVAGYRSSDADQVQASSTLMPVAPHAEVLGLVRHVLGGLDPTAVRLAAPPARARWLAPLTAWTMAFGQDADVAVSRRGFWVRRVDVVPQRRVQSARASQGPLQRRLRLADLHLDSPPGPVRLRGELRDEQEARALLEEAVVVSRAARHRADRSAGAQPSSTETPPVPDTTQ